MTEQKLKFCRHFWEEKFWSFTLATSWQFLNQSQASIFETTLSQNNAASKCNQKRPLDQDNSQCFYFIWEISLSGLPAGHKLFGELLVWRDLRLINFSVYISPISQGMKWTFFSRSHLAPKCFKVIAKKKGFYKLACSNRASADFLKQTCLILNAYHFHRFRLTH